MFKVNGKTITMTRGDTVKIDVTMKDADGQTYTPVEGEVIRFKAKRNWIDESAIIEKAIPIDTLILHIAPEDTHNLQFGTYVYDIQITHLNGDVDTFISKGTLIISEETD